MYLCTVPHQDITCLFVSQMSKMNWHRESGASNSCEKWCGTFICCVNNQNHPVLILSFKNTILAVVFAKNYDVTFVPHHDHRILLPKYFKRSYYFLHEKKNQTSKHVVTRNRKLKCATSENIITHNQSFHQTDPIFLQKKWNGKGLKDFKHYFNYLMSSFVDRRDLARLY